MQRRNRLSRSRDFDAVYRQGRSVSTRFLVLYWFPRDGRGRRAAARARRAEGAGNAVDRNRIKRQLREVWRERARADPRRPRLRADRAPGLAEAVEANGLRLARRAGRRGAREGGGMRYRRLIGARLRSYRFTLGCRSSASASASTTRPARSTRSTRCASTGSFAGIVLAGWRLLRCNPWSHGGVDHARDQRSSVIAALIAILHAARGRSCAASSTGLHSTSACRGRGRSSR